MNKAGKTLISFNVKNGQYAIGTNSPKPLSFFATFAKEKNLDSKIIYGDGEIQATVYNDKGMTSTMTLTGRDEEYGIALGLMMKLGGGGIAEIQQVKSIEHSVYFETYDLIKASTGEEFKQTTAKVWVFGVTTSAPSETLTQNTDGINENMVDYPGTIKGTKLMDDTGNKTYRDENGNELNVFTYKKRPSDDGYDEFEKTVPIPKASAAVGA